MKKGASAGRALWRFAWRALLAGSLLFSLFILYVNLVAKRAGQGLLFDDLSRIPPQSVALVFGTTDKIGSQDNLYFTHRIDAAAELWEAGKVECLLVSGDNRDKYYNEPNMMRDALIERGVPKEKIVRDFAGLRTLDSVVRAQEVFQAPSVILVSQKFHNERAAYIARAAGLPHVGYNAKDVKVSVGFRTQLREVAARVAMWLDVRVLDTKPRHLGPIEPLPIESQRVTLAQKEQQRSDQ